jgi:hypothetical protein
MKNHPKRCVMRNGDGKRCEEKRLKPSIYCMMHQPEKKVKV